MTNSLSGQALEVLTLELDGERFAIDAAHVREILDHVGVTEVPLAQPFVNGLINVRGKVAPLADLRLKLGLAHRPPTVDSRIVVVELALDGEQLLAGLRADKVHEVTTVAATALQPAPRIGTSWRPEFVRCVARQEGRDGETFIVVLDTANIFRAALGADPAVAQAA